MFLDHLEQTKEPVRSVPRETRKTPSDEFEHHPRHGIARQGLVKVLPDGLLEGPLGSLNPVHFIDFGVKGANQLGPNTVKRNSLSAEAVVPFHNPPYHTTPKPVTP